GRLNERLSLELPVTAIFRYPTIAELAQAVDASMRAAADHARLLKSEIDALSDEEVERLLAELEGARSLGADARQPG
ncbi:MAG TPA: phosphopantetheine-binding protein, partial [Burkholderiaceae bacterium]|nr:phosphopantetheine-binding protein [Burkholderiaceae bacterium]